MIMLFFDHKWFSLQRMVYLFQVWLKVNFWSDPFTKVDNRLCIRQRVCFPSLSNTSTNRYLCKNPKENIESTYRQTVCFQWGHSEENISEKAKCMPSLDSRLNKQCPNNGPKVFSSKVLENLVNWTLWTFLPIILSQVYLRVSISCFSEKKFKAFLPI